MKKILSLSALMILMSLAAPVEVAEASGGYIHGYYHYYYPIRGHYPPPLRARVAPAYRTFRGGFGTPPGRIDIEVEPKKAQVFIDGHFIGTADKFDGWPSHLYLRQGTYKITLVHPGYETVTHTVAVFPRQRMTLELPMTPGESTPPPEPKSESKPQAAEGQERLER